MADITNVPTQTSLQNIELSDQQKTSDLVGASDALLSDFKSKDVDASFKGLASFSKTLVETNKIMNSITKAEQSNMSFWQLKAEFGLFTAIGVKLSNLFGSKTNSDELKKSEASGADVKFQAEQLVDDSLSKNSGASNNQMPDDFLDAIDPKMVVHDPSKEMKILTLPPQHTPSNVEVESHDGRPRTNTEDAEYIATIFEENELKNAETRSTNRQIIESGNSDTTFKNFLSGTENPTKQLENDVLDEIALEQGAERKKSTDT
ncbi:MAG: hypothetical protein AAGH74_11065 [Pseudomonadota bacterium]